MASIYSMTKRADGWVISAGNNEILTCSRREIAIRVIHQAAVELLGEAISMMNDEAVIWQVPPPSRH